MNWDTLNTAFATGSMILNKAVIVGIVVLIIWALQALTTHPDVLDRYPFTKHAIMRLSLTLIGVAVIMDFFSVYIPAPSEIILNLSMLAIMLFIYRAWKTGQLVKKNGNGNH
jgi:hypothetical protein